MTSLGAIITGAKSIRGSATAPSTPQGLGTAQGRVSPLSVDLHTGADANWGSAYQALLPRPPATFTNGAFGPFNPIAPTPVDTIEGDSGQPDPRLFQYEVGWNLPVGQPGSEGIKLADFGTLRTLADLYSVARAAIQLRKAEIRGLEWDITPTRDASKSMRGNRSAMKDFGTRRAEALAFFRRPDPDYFNWSSFIDAFLEEVFVFDALSLLIRMKWGKGQRKGVLGSDLDSLSLLSGPTIRPLLGLHGERPRPPAPAYQQYLYGVPRCDLMSLIQERDLKDGMLSGAEMKNFRADQLLYVPMVPRRWTPYGFPPIERALIPVMSGLQKQGYQLDFFREGSIPGLFVSPGGVNANMTPNQLRELQQALNAISGDPAWKHKIIVLPADSTVTPQRPVQLADQFDEIVMNQVCCVPGTEVMTHAGLVAIEDVQVGDVVLTHRGNWRPVRGVTRNPVHEPVRRLKANSFEPLEVTGNHPVWAARYGQLHTHRQVYQETRWTAAREVLPKRTRGEFDALTLPIPVTGTSDATLRLIDHVSGRGRYKVREVGDQLVHSRTDVVPIPARVPLSSALGRLLGFYMAEGHTTGNAVSWSFHRSEVTYQEQVRDDLFSVFGLRAKVKPINGENCTTIVCNHALLARLLSFGTATVKCLPAWAWGGSPEFYAALLWAWVAGDGTYGARGWRGATTSKTLAWQMRLVAIACGHEPQLASYDLTGTPPSLIDGREVRYNASAMYTVAVTYKGERRGTYRVDGPHLTSPVRSNELSSYDGDVVYNLEVEGDESYVTTGGTVHNCMAMDVQPMELGIMPKVSTTVSPGAANQMAKATQGIHERKATKPTLTYIADIMNAILHDVCKQDDMQFTFEGLEEDEDEETLTSLLVQQVSFGLRSVDEGREQLGLQPWGLPETSDPGWGTQTGFIPLGQITAEGMPANGVQPTGFSQEPPSPTEPPPPSGSAATAPAPKPPTSTTGGTGTQAASRGGTGQSPGHDAASASTAPAKRPTPARRKVDVPRRAEVSELEALGRHLRKGRELSTWERRHLGAEHVARLSEHLSRGMPIDLAVYVVRSMLTAEDEERVVDLDGQVTYAEVDDDEESLEHTNGSAGGGGPVQTPHDALGRHQLAKDASDLTDPNPVEAEHVMNQMRRNYPEKALGWMQGARWIGPVLVPQDRINYHDVGSWAASHDQARVADFAHKIKRGKAHLHPVVAVQEQGDDKVKIIDGHHRTLAYRKLGEPVKAYVGFVNQTDGPWDETHLYQFKAGTSPGNKVADA